MSKINHTQLQDESEIACTQKFLLSYNTKNKTAFFKIVKNDIQNEIDTLCFDPNQNKMNIQVKKAHPSRAENIGKSRGKTIEEKIVKRGNETSDDIMQNIMLVDQKYRDQGKDMSDIILLLDEFISPPVFLFNHLIGISTGFKEVWLVSRNADPIRLA